MDESDMVELAMSETLDCKIKKAIYLLKIFESTATGKDPGGYFLCNSGGKDSTCIHHDPPELMRFIRRTYPEMIYHRKAKTLLNRMIEKGNPPTRRGRWCCSEYKETGDSGRTKIIGVRAAESARRKGLWKQVVKTKDNGIIICPILYWTEQDVWSFHRMYNLPFCELYSEGFSRLGCIGCPLGGNEGQARDFKRWKNYEKMWHNAFIKMWEKWHNVPNKFGKPRFFEKLKTAEGFWQWWINNDKYYEHNKECQGEFMFGIPEEENEENERGVL